MKKKTLKSLLFAGNCGQLSSQFLNVYRFKIWVIKTKYIKFDIDFIFKIVASQFEFG